MKTLEELQGIISKKINGFCEKNGSGSIYQPVNYILQLGGKRLRPALSLMTANLYSDDIDEAVYPAIAIEIFHNFTLMHDDIMDNAPLRRGKPTVHAKWNRDVAILSGDAMLIQAYQLLVKTRPEILADVLHIFNTTALQVCEGQQLDMDFQDRSDVSIDEYIEMIRLKTSVLLGCAMKTGAIISGAGKEDQEKIYTIGEYIGVCFQLLDDYLDAFGDGNKTGKQVGGDILAGKKTFLMLRALEKAGPQEKEKLRNYLFDKDLSDKEKVEAVIAIYKDLGVDVELRKKALSLHEKAMNSLDELLVDTQRKIPLKNLLSQMLQRES